jgi:hypothetical protein
VSWQDAVLSSVRNRDRGTESLNTAFGRALKPMNFSCTVAYVLYVNRAARAMGVNRSTYVRRALAVHAAHVLGIDVREILWESPAPRRWDPQQAKGLRDDGFGIGAWCPHPGCDGSHL